MVTSFKFSVSGETDSGRDLGHLFWRSLHHHAHGRLLDLHWLHLQRHFLEGNKYIWLLVVPTVRQSDSRPGRIAATESLDPVTQGSHWNVCRLSLPLRTGSRLADFWKQHRILQFTQNENVHHPGRDPHALRYYSWRLQSQVVFSI